MAGGIALYEAKNTEIILQNCAKALKKDGYLVFLENLSSTSLHMLCRRKLIKWSWHYYTINELEQEINKVKQFKIVGHKEYGITACFGRTEKQRIILGKLDSMLEKICPKHWRYITCWILRKI